MTFRIGPTRELVRQLALGVAIVALGAGCASNPQVETTIDKTRSQLNEIQANPLLAERAPGAVREAQRAIEAAEEADLDSERGQHLAFIAEQKVDIAEARAWRRYYEDQRQQLIAERDNARLAARTREADQARQDAQAFQRETEQLRRELEDMTTRKTDQGIVLNLPEVMFEFGEYNLKSGAEGDLDRLAEFMRQYPQREIRIQGHTDSVGDEEYNRELSQRRANAVKQYLVAQGVEASRVATIGRGEAMPVASNDTAAGRQLNRRVEILIENPAVAATSNRR